MIKLLPLVKDNLPEGSYIWGTTHSTVWISPIGHNVRFALWGESEHSVRIYLDLDELGNRNEIVVPVKGAEGVIRSYINEILAGTYD